MATVYSAVIIAVVISAALVQGQRPSFAGTQPIGFPAIQNKTTASPLENRFGEGSTERLPVEANGDRGLIDRISKFPVDQQPFWYLNWKAAEEHRNKPQTYPQRPSQFAEVPLGSLGTLNVNAPNSGGFGSGVPDLGNRHGEVENNLNGNKNPMVEAGLQSPRNNMTAFGHYPSKQ